MGCYSVLSWFISAVTRNVACTLWKIIWCISIKLKFELTILILNCHQFENVSSWNYVTKLKGLAINKMTSSQVAGVRLSMWQGMSTMGSGCGVGVLWSHGVHAPMDKPCAYVSIRCSNQQLKTAAPFAAFSLTTESVKADVAFSSFSRHPVAFLPPCLIFHSDLSYSVPMKCFYGCVKFAGIIIK